MAARTSTKPSDEEVVEQIISGDTELFSEIINRYQRPLIVYTKRVTFSQQAAEDVTQNAFIKSYQNLRGFDTKKKFSSWIYRIAHNEAVNYVRKHRREITTSEETWFESKASDREGVEETVERKMNDEMLAAALMKLPLKYREPIILHTLEGKSYDEVSEILRIPSATVGTRIRRGKAKLKTIMKAKGVSND